MTIGLEKPKRKVDPELLARIRELPCVVCGAPGPSDASHIQSKGAGGHDTEFNIFPKCRDCHREFHDLGWYRFLGKHPRFAEVLMDAGWEIDTFTQTLFHRKLR